MRDKPTSTTYLTIAYSLSSSGSGNDRELTENEEDERESGSDLSVNDEFPISDLVHSISPPILRLQHPNSSILNEDDKVLSLNKDIETESFIENKGLNFFFGKSSNRKRSRSDILFDKLNYSMNS